MVTEAWRAELRNVTRASSHLSEAPGRLEASKTPRPDHVEQLRMRSQLPA